MLRNAYSVLKDLPGDAYGDDGTPADEAGQAALPTFTTRAGSPASPTAGPACRHSSSIAGLRDRGELTVRVNATRDPRARRSATAKPIVAKLNELAATRPAGEPNGPTGVGDHWVRIGPMKVFLDGGMLNGTAYMREPWGVGPTYQITEPDYRGLLFIKPEVLAHHRRGGRPPRLADDRPLRGRGGHGRAARGLRPRRPSRRHPPPALADHARQLHLGREPEAVRGAGRLGRLAAGLALEGHADLAQGARPEADGVVPSLPQVARRRRDDRRRQRPHDPHGPARCPPTRGTPGWASGSP